MSYIDQRMPERISAGFTIGPEWSTLIVPLDNGREQRNRQWLYPKYRGRAGLGAFNAVDRQALIGLFFAAAGRANAFRVKDPTDYFVAGEQLAVSAGTSTPAQLSREREFGSVSTTMLIQAPVSGTTTIYRNGVAYTDCTIDYATGLVTPTTTWAAGTYTFDTQYDRWMRFDSDWAAFTAAARDVWSTEIELVEVRR